MDAVTLSDPTVDEGGNATITASVNNAPDGTDLVLTLSNGETITIDAGTTSGSVTFAVQGDDAYVDGESFDVSISSTSGGNYEDLNTDDVATVTVEDTIDTTTVTLSDPTVDEGGNATITASVNNAPDGTDLVLTLSNGETITIDAGTTSGSVTFAVQGDDAYVDGESFDVSISSTSGGNYEDLNTDDVATVTVEDTIDTTTVTLSDPTVDEGGNATITASVNNAPDGTDLVLTLSNGETITIDAGTTSGSVTFAVQGDDAYVDGESFDVSISSTSGGNYEDLNTDDVATVTVEDTIDTTTVTLSDPTVDEGGNATITASVNNAPDGTDLVLTLSNGETITIDAGTTSGSVTFAVQGDDAYVDGESFDVSISSTSGGNYEDLNTDDVATVTVEDTIDTTTVTLSDPTVDEGGNATITASVNNAPDGTDLVLTLSNGETITIDAGTTSGSVTFAVQGDDAYVDGESFDVSISSTSGGNYEDLNTDDVATVTVEDTIDTTTVTLSDPTVDEGGNATITASVNNAPDGTDLVLTLSNGETITIDAGTTSGSVTFAVQGDDAYVDGESFDVSISSTSGGNYEDLNTDDVATVTVEDTIDTTTVTLSDPTVDEGGNATITASVNNAPDGTDLVLTLSNGETITIDAGTTSGSVTFAVQGDDAYVDGESFDVSISSTSGGNYEDLNTDDVATVTVEDTIDTTTVTLSDPTVDEGGNATITASVNNAPDGTDLVLTLSNGETITIDAGTTSGSVTFAVQGDDAYVDGESFDVSISSTSGGNYEDLNTDDVATVTVEDTIDTTTVTLSDPTVDEGGNATITASVNNAPDGTDLVLTLSNGETITIDAGTTSGSVTFAVQGDDAYVDGESFDVSISSTSGGNYEDLNTDDVATVTVEDTIDTTTVTLSDPTVDEGGNATITASVNNAPDGTDLVLTLSNGETITIDAGTTSGSVTFAVQGDDAYVDGESFDVSISSTSGGNYEDLNTDDVATVTVEDTIDTTTVTLSDPTVDEGGNATITASVNNAPDGTDLVLTLSNGETITIDAGTTSGSVTFAVQGDDAYVDGESFDVSISSTSGGNYEDLNTDDVATVTVEDTIDTTTVTLSDPTVDEGGNATITASVNNAPDGTDLVLTLSNGETITIDAGTTSGSVTFAVQGDDAYVDGESFDVSISSTSGGNYEDLNTDDVATVTVEDTIDTTTVTLSDPTVDEGGNATITASVNNAPDGTDLVLTLSNGETITIDAGTTSGSVTFAVQGDDAYVDGESFDVSISSTSGGNYEDLNTDDVATVTVEDTIDTTTVTLSDPTVDEGGNATITASVNNAPDGTDLVLTLSNGETITIDAGTTSGSVTFAVQGDDAYVDGESFDVSISSTSGGNYEDLNTDDVATVTVEDTIDTTTVTLSDPTVDEGGNATITASVNNAPDGTDLVLTLSNGETITIDAGTTSGSVTFAVQGDDAYVDGESFDVSISSTSGGNYEDLNTDDVATVTVEDTIDTTTVTLSDPTVDEGGNATITASVNNAPDGTDLVLTLSNGETITIDAGTTSGSVTFAVQGDDAYVDGESFDVSISSTSGGNYEDLNTDDVATVTVEDTIDTTTVTLSDPTVDEGGNATITASVNNAPDGTDLVLTLSNGETITIDAGTTSGSVTFAVQGDDAYVDGESFDVSISSTSGGNYEDLNTDDVATVTVEDTIDTTTVTLSDPTVDEGGNATITASVNNAPDGTDLVLTLSNGETITIDAGTTSGSVTFAVQGDDAYVDGESFDVSISSTSGGNYEDLNTDDVATVTVEDTIDTTTVTLSDPTVDEGGNATITASVNNAPDGTDLVLTLSNGETITIDAGTTSGSVTFAVQGDDAYVDGESFDVSISSTSGGNYEDLNTDDVATVTVEDTIDTTTVTLSDPTVDEGGNATITASVNNAPDGTDLVLTLSNGETITIDAGTTSGSVTFAVQGDDAYVDGESFDVSISSTSGGNYEDLNTDDVATVTVEDTIDTTTVTLSDPTVDEGGNATITASVNNAPDGTDLVLTLSNGETITIDAGTTSGSVTFAVQGDDAYVDGESFDVSISSTSGGNYEDLNTDDVATVTVEDTIDTTTVTLSDPTVDEGGNATITASVNNAPDGTDLVLTLSNGETITIDAGTTSGSVTFAVQGDDAYVDGESFDVSISSTSGGNYEDLNTDDVATVTVEDTIDTTTVTLSDPTVDEGGNATITASVNNAPDGTDLVLTLSNGETITIDAGTTSGSVTFAVQGDDAYVDGESFDVSISSTSGGNYEDLNTDDVATVTVEDTIDTTTVTLSDPTVDEGGNATITASVNNAPDGTDLVLTLSNGETITIDAGTTSGSVTFAVQGDDAYVDGESFDVSISSTSGGNYEDLNTDDVATVTVEDTIDTTTVTLSDPTVDEGGNATITASVNNAPDGTDLVLTLSNGETITIDAGTTSGSVTFAVQGDDAYVDGESFDVSISSTSGGNYEDLNTDDVATVTVEDTIDTTTVTLSDPTVDEGGNATITASVNNAPDGTDLVLTLSNGETITIDAGTTSGSVTFAVQGDDAYVDGESFDVSISSTSGGNYEDLNTDDVATATVEDTIDTTTVTLSDPTVDEGGNATITASVNNAPDGTDLVLTLSNGETITIDAGTTSGSVTFAVQGDDAYVDGESFDVSISSTSGGNYEDLNTDDVATVTVEDTIDTTTVTLSDPTVDEGGNATITASVNNAPDGTDLVLTLSNGETITIDAGTTSGSVTFAVQGDDAYVDGESFDVSISSTSGGNYEDLNTDDVATVTVEDTTDTTTVTLSDPTVDEGGNATITASVNNAPDGTDLVLTLSNGETITIDAGTTSGSVTFAVQGDDAYVDGESFDVSISSTSGGNYEDLNTDDVATVTVEDTIDTTTVSITGDTSVIEGDTAQYTISLSNPPQGDVTVEIQYSGTANGSDFTGTLPLEITIPSGTSSYDLDLSTFDDSIVEGAENITLTLTNPTGGNFENLIIAPDGGSVTTTITDNDVYIQPHVEDVVISLSEEGLTDGLADTTGTPDTTNDATASGDLTIIDPDSSSFTITLSEPTSTLKSSGEVITWTGDGTQTLVGSTASGGVIITATINDNGHYEVTLSGPVDHDVVNEEDVLSFDIGVTTSDGTTPSVTSVITVNVEDDSPDAVNATALSLSNDAGTYSAGLTALFGADGSGGLSLENNDPGGMTSNGEAVSYHIDGAVLVAHAGTYSADDTSNYVFKLTLNEGDNDYDFQLFQSIDALELVSIGAASSFGAGPSGFQALMEDLAGEHLALLSGWTTTEGFNFDNWQTTGNLGTNTTAAEVNGSERAWGVTNGNFDTNEIIRFDFDDLDPYNGLNDASIAPVVFDGPPVQLATFALTNPFKGGDTLAYVIHYTNGDIGTAGTANGVMTVDELTAASGSNTFTLGEAGKFIDYIEIMVVSGSGGIDLSEVSTVTNTGTSNLSFNITATDGDLDTATGTLDVTITPSENIPATITATPVDTLYESALDTGSGVPAEGTAEVQGQFAINDPGDTVTGITITSTNGTPVTLSTNGSLANLEGQQANFDVNGDGIYDGTLTIDSYDSSTGIFTYTYTLTNDVDHNQNADDPTLQAEDFAFDLTFGLVDGTATPSTAAVPFSIVDDSPIANPLTIDVPEGTTQSEPTNILITLDLSGSMAWDSEGNWLSGNGTDPDSRLAQSIESIKELAAAYDAIGGFNIQIVTFSGTTMSHSSSMFTEIGNATTAGTLAYYLDGLRTADGTYYDQAIAEAQSVWTDNTGSDANINSSNSVAYFISDGVPDPSSSALSSEEQATWEAYVNQNFGISYAIGIGSGAPGDADLQSIAHTPGSYPGDADDAIFTVNNLNDLTDTLTSTVIGSAEGNVFVDGNSGNLIGADGTGAPTLVSLTYDLDGDGGNAPVTITFDQSNPDIYQNITLDHGATLSVNGLGEYHYTAAVGITEDYSVTMSYVIQDGDGSQATASATFTSLENTGLLVAMSDVAHGVEGYYTSTASWTITPDGFDGSNGYEGDVDTGYFEVSTASGSVSVTALVQITDLHNGDTLDVTLVDENGNTIGTTSFNSTDSGSNTISFNVTSSGNYKFVIHGDDATDGSMGSGYSLSATLSSIALDGTAVSEFWIPGVDPIAGNVLANDSAPETAIVSKIEFDGSSENVNNSGATIEGEYGTLYIQQDGSYRYTQNSGDLGSGDLVDEFTYTVKEGGSTETATLKVEISGSHNDNIQTQGDDYLEGTSGVDNLTSIAGNDILVGGDSSDILIGSDGDNILIGGAGNDTLTGGSGADIFRFESGDEIGNPTDTITDFNVSEGDVLDISDMLTGLTGVTLSGDNAADAQSLGSGGYLNFSYDGSKTTLTIDMDGQDASSGEVQTIIFNNVDLTSYGSSDAQIIQNLLNGIDGGDPNLDI